MIDFFIEEKPIPKGRPKFRRVGQTVFPYTPPKTARWEELIANVAEAYAPEHPLKCAIEVRLDFLLLCPVSWSGRKRRQHHQQVHAQRPDIDNLVKAVLDGLSPDPNEPRKTLFLDDGQIARITAGKCWDMMREGVRIRVRPYQPHP